MGPNRVQRASDKRGLLHEHPAQQYGGVHRYEEYGELRAGPDTVSEGACVQDLIAIGGSPR